MKNRTLNSYGVLIGDYEGYLHCPNCSFQSRVGVTDTVLRKEFVPRNGDEKQSWKFARTANNAHPVGTSQVSSIQTHLEENLSKFLR